MWPGSNWLRADVADSLLVSLWWLVDVDGVSLLPSSWVVRVDVVVVVAVVVVAVVVGDPDSVLITNECVVVVNLY